MSVNSIVLLGGLLVVGLLLIFVGIPLLARLTLGLEVVRLIIDSLGDYFENPRLVQLGCLAFVLIVLSACCVAGLLVVAFASCFTSNPSGICYLIGR